MRAFAAGIAAVMSGTEAVAIAAQEASRPILHLKDGKAALWQHLNGISPGRLRPVRHMMDRHDVFLVPVFSKRPRATSAKLGLHYAEWADWLGLC